MSCVQGVHSVPQNQHHDNKEIVVEHTHTSFVFVTHKHKSQKSVNPLQIDPKSSKAHRKSQILWFTSIPVNTYTGFVICVCDSQTQTTNFYIPRNSPSHMLQIVHLLCYDMVFVQWHFFAMYLAKFLESVPIPTLSQTTNCEFVFVSHKHK